MTLLKSFRSVGVTLWPRCCHPRPADLALVSGIKQYAADLALASDGEIRKLTARLRERVAGGESICAADIVTPSFALTYEAVRRALGMSLYDVQLLAGIVLSTGAIAEMQTGEGKTIVAALPAVLHALGGEGVHLATVNSYLAERDYRQLRPAFELLGLSVGLVQDQAAPDHKKAAYDCDITYATGYQLGFDYLFDQITLQRRNNLQLGQAYRDRLRNRVATGRPTMQRGHKFAIIDEIDSVLIDEATTPLILSGAANPGGGGPDVFELARDVAAALVQDRDFVMDQREGRINLTEGGASRIYSDDERMPRSGLARPWSVYIEQALRAQHFLKRDDDYVVRDGEIMIVDENTGRIFAERTWSDGLHQAVEAKERIAITDEKCAIARISRQRYFRLYETICGMTGTACGNEFEFLSFYKLPVVAIPLRKPSQRVQIPTRYFADEEAKYAAVAGDVAQRHRKGQPVLIGTRTIENSRLVARHLARLGVPYQILNGIQDDDEATLVAAAGEPGRITIATNMAGRGTDIKPPCESLEAGGLHVIATEHHESARIDRQLIGRSARQGDPGSCQFLVAATDELVSRFDPKLKSQIEENTGPKGETLTEFSRPVARLQQKCEKRDFIQRCQLLRQEKWLENVLASVAKEE